VNCTVCGSRMKKKVSDLPFKTSEHTIVVLKGIPLWQCEVCAEYLLEDDVMRRVDEILAGVGAAAELEVIRYAA
jgi:YgiT-type zinc finger domain-containing protein